MATRSTTGAHLTGFRHVQGLVLDEGDSFSEAFSGARLFRPALDRLLVRAKSGNGRYKCLLVAKWIFSAILPAIYLTAAAAEIRNL